MKRIPLNQFERIVNDTILKKGLHYYRNGCVTDVAKLSDFDYEASVNGTEKYAVRLKIHCYTFEEGTCSCLHDKSSICRHIVATVLYLKQCNFNPNNEGAHATKAVKSKTVSQQVNELLEKVSHAELKDFIVAQSKTDEHFSNLFLSTFTHLDNNLSKEFYREQINSIVQAATDRHGFIGWHEMSNFEGAIYPIVTSADKHYEEKNYKIAFYMATALMEEMILAMEFSDSSGNEIGGIIDDAFGMLHNMATAVLPKDLRRDIFNYCITAYKKELFEGWDWHLDILRIAYRFVENEADADRILKCLDTVKEDYDKERAQTFKLAIISEYKNAGL